MMPKSELKTIKGIDNKGYFFKLKKPAQIKEKKNVGFDTETDKNGNLFLITCSNGDYLIKPDVLQILEFLHLHTRGKTGWFFNLRFDIEAILKPVFVKKHAGYEDIKKNKIKIGNYIVTLKGIKSITICDKQRNLVQFFDVANFFEGSLEQNAKEYLGEEKMERKIEELEKGIATDEIIKYSIKDAELTKKLADYLISTLKQFMPSIPRKFYSKASIAQHYLLSTIDISELEASKRLYPVFEIAYNSFYGGMFLARVKGLVEGYEYDINSAYPYEIANLISLKDAQVKYIRNKDANPMADYGFYEVEYCPDGWLPFRSPDDLVVYPQTDRYIKNTVTANEIAYFKRHGISYRIIKGVEIYCPNKNRPFEESIQKLYTLKQKYKQEENKGLYWLVKVIMNSIYGKFVQTAGKKLGRLFNPIWGSYITSRTRIKLVEFARNNFSEIYELATDAIFGIPKNEIKSSEELGKFSFKGKIKTIIIQTGVHLSPDLTKFQKFRGFRTKAIPEIKQKEIIVKFERPSHIRESLIQDRVEDISKFDEYQKVIKLEDDKMLWIDKLTTEKLKTRHFEGEPLTYEAVCGLVGILPE